MKKQTPIFDKEKALEKISKAFSNTDKYKDFNTFLLFLHFSFPEFLPYSTELFSAASDLKAV